jgi:hypothetical protein
MKLTLLSIPGPKAKMLQHHIQQRLERPHVPLKFLTNYAPSDDYDFLACIIRNPKDFIAATLASKSDITADECVELCRNSYNHALKNADIVIDYDEISENIDSIIKHIYDALKLDSQNYLNKTGRVLSDDILLQPEHQIVLEAEPDLLDNDIDLSELDNLYSILINSDRFMK